MNDTPALEVRDVTKKYASGTEALKGVSLTIPHGSLYALLGPNGAGKTTLIGIVTGLVRKTSGTVSVFGIDADQEPERTRALIGLVGQEVNFNPFEKPLDIVVNQAGYYGVPRVRAVPRATQILTDLGLADKMHSKAIELSGGMKRRLMIARALVHEPKFLILDEPTAGVDVELRRSMWEYLTTLTKGGLTILLTTHYLEEAEKLADRVAIIAQGSIVADGTMGELLARYKGERDDPYTTGRLESLFLELTHRPHAA